MADMKEGGIDAIGFKLFGKTIPVEIRQVVKEEMAKTGDAPEKRPEKVIPCPRCKSIETKFCYFNNYNVNQPRHFCKGCQRYWTAGGTLRNVPVGAGRRKNKLPCHGFIGFSDTGMSDGSMVNEFDLEGLVEQWHAAASGGVFRHVLPAKRRSISSSTGHIC